MPVPRLSSLDDDYGCLDTMWSTGFLDSFHEDVMQLVNPFLVLAARDDPLHPQYKKRKMEEASLVASPMPPLSVAETLTPDDVFLSDAAPLVAIAPVQPESTPTVETTSSSESEEEEEGGILIADEPVYHPRQDHCYLARPKPEEILLVDSSYLPSAVTELTGYGDNLFEEVNIPDVDVSDSVLDICDVDVSYFERQQTDDDEEEEEDSDSYSDTEEEYKSPKSESLPLVTPEESIDVWNIKNSRYIESPVKRKGKNTYTPRAQAKKATIYEESYPRRGRMLKNIRLAPTSYEVEKALKSTRGRTRKTKAPAKKNERGNKRIDHNELEKERRSQQRDLLQKLQRVIPNDYFKNEDSRTKNQSKQNILQAAKRCVQNYQSENRTLKDIKRQHAEEHRKLFSEYLRLRKSVVKLVNWKA